MRPREERGTATIELVWLALVLIVPLVYLLLAVFDVQRAAYATSAASSAAARAYLRAPDVGTAEARARAAAQVALSDQEVRGGRVEIDCTPSRSRCLQPGSGVRITVRASRALPFVPDALGGPIASVAVDSTHTEPYGSYRAGAP